jgi:hypothetical protein
MDSKEVLIGRVFHQARKRNGKKELQEIPQLFYSIERSKSFWAS